MPISISKLLADTIISPMLSIKRYKDARKEISRVIKLDTKFRDIHLKNTRVLTDRNELLSLLGEGGVVAEVGVASGDFSDQILQTCKPRILHLIDYWANYKSAHGMQPADLVKRYFTKKDQSWSMVNSRFKKQVDNGSVVLHRGYSWDMLEELSDNVLDWIYIDAAHDYRSVSRDLEVAQRKVKKNGIIAGHDYVRWGRFGYRCGVVEAVNEFCIKNGYELLYITLETRTNSSFAIRKIS